MPSATPAASEEANPGLPITPETPQVASGVAGVHSEHPMVSEERFSLIPGIQAMAGPDDDSDSDDEEVQARPASPDVQLGFLDQPELSGMLEHPYFPCKVGGMPVGSLAFCFLSFILSSH